MIARVRALLAIALVCGCGKIDFDPLADAHGVDGLDVDAAVGPALCGIPFGQWTLTAPVALDDINSLLIVQFPANGDQDEYDSVFSQDGLSLYFTSDQSGAFQVWVATRPTVTAAFDSVMLLGPDVNAATNGGFGFQPLASLRIAIIAAPYTGTIGGDDFWLGSNTTGSWTWSPTDLSTPSSDIDARMTADGLTVYFPRGAAIEDRDIYRSTRADLASDFGAQTLLPELNSAASDASPVPVADGIFVVTARPGGAGGDDIWYAARSSTGGFDALYPLTALNTPSVDGEPAMLDLGGSCELIFSSTRAGSSNLYRSLAMPL